MSTTEFAGLTVSLRAPRLAVLIPRLKWELHARRGIEFLSKTWGGASGVLVPTDATGVHPAVRRLLRKFDPDYIAPVAVTLTDLELLHPGLVQLRREGRLVRSPAKRAALIAEIERSTATLSPSLAEETINAASEGLPCFSKRSTEFRRIHHVHPSEEAARPLSPVTIPPEHQVAVETGDVLLDLAIAMQRGSPTRQPRRSAWSRRPRATWTPVRS